MIPVGVFAGAADAGARVGRKADRMITETRSEE
jgi:hypothetical protein